MSATDTDKDVNIILRKVAKGPRIVKRGRKRYKKTIRAFVAKFDDKGNMTLEEIVKK